MNNRDYTTIRTADKINKLFNEIYSTGKTSDFVDYGVIRGDGSIGFLEISAGLLRDHNTKPIGFHGVVRDVTEKKKFEKEIRIKSYAIEKSMNAIAITEPGGGISFVNNSFLTMWGFTNPDDLLGKTILQCCHPDARDDLFNVFEVLDEIGSWVGELFLKKIDGSGMYTILSASLIKNENEETIGIVLSFVDITLRKKVDYALKEKHTIITKRNKEIERDLKMAQVTLKDIMNQQVPALDAITIDYRYNPVEKLGGDFFCFYTFQKDSFGVLICDVSGHGVASSLYLSLLKSITDRLSVKYGQSPVKFISQLNSELFGRMSSYFITGIYGLFTYQKKSGEYLFSYTNGGHPGPVVARKNGEVTLYTGKSTLIGISNDISFDSTTIHLAPGDRLFLYTDGVPETSNMYKDMIGYDDLLLDLFRTTGDLSLHEKLNGVMKKIGEFRNGAEITDDTLIIGFEVAK
jgi:PAS domain S-box-containing protein